MGQSSAEIIDFGRYKAARTAPPPSTPAFPAPPLWPVTMVWLPVWMPVFVNALPSQGHRHSNA
jgi:hypothetical protein